jgi:hypothetical protein
MRELQQEFLLDVLAPFLTEAHCPLLTLRNPPPQDCRLACIPSGASTRTISSPKRRSTVAPPKPRQYRPPAAAKSPVQR